MIKKTNLIAIIVSCILAIVPALVEGKTLSVKDNSAYATTSVSAINSPTTSTTKPILQDDKKQNTKLKEAKPIPGDLKSLLVRDYDESLFVVPPIKVFDFDNKAPDLTWFIEILKGSGGNISFSVTSNLGNITKVEIDDPCGEPWKYYIRFYVGDKESEKFEVEYRQEIPNLLQNGPILFSITKLRNDGNDFYKKIY